MSKSETQNNPFEAFQKGFPQIDFNKATEIAQKSFEANLKLQKTMLEKGQKLAQQQVEFFQAQAEKATKAASDALSAKSPEENIEKGQKYAQSQFEASVQNAQEVAKASSKLATEGFEAMNKQAVQNLNEISKLAEAS